jgi:uncharacterized protein (TIGR04255 family)
VADDAIEAVKVVHIFGIRKFHGLRNANPGHTGADILVESPTTLTLPDIEAVVFARNFIQTAVCELRFPTLVEFETQPPTQLQKALRKDYPYYESGQAVIVRPETVNREARYLFKSRKKDWTVSFKSSAIALETSRYTSFEEFLMRFRRLLEKSQPLLDTDFFTRIGLRYVDAISIKDDNLSGWVRDDLVPPLVKGVYGTVEQCVQEVRGFTEVGRYTFKHGTLAKTQDGFKIYNLDFDFYEENVQLDKVIPLLEQFNQLSFRFFHWAIGPKALERLGKETVTHVRK